MRFLFLFFAVFLFCFQTIKGFDSADTAECKLGGGFCTPQPCPAHSELTGGTCVDGRLTCCKWPQRERPSD